MFENHLNIMKLTMTQRQQQQQQQQPNNQHHQHQHASWHSNYCNSINSKLTSMQQQLYTRKHHQHYHQQMHQSKYWHCFCKNICNSRLFLVVGLIIFVIAGNVLVEGALRNVSLIIEPPAVRRGQHVVLRCLYDLHGSPLYAAKFYRGQLEFYRYTPGEFPNTKVFPFPGINVDVTCSNATQVLLRNVDFGLSGNFSCEVTADAPLFSTATAIGTMQVVELPEKRPLLFTEQPRYDPGEILRANCSTPPSRPRAELTFTINNMVIPTNNSNYIRTIDNLIATRISMTLPLQGIHFSSINPSMLHGHNGMGNAYGGQMMNSVHGPSGMGNGGGLVLRCTAQIGDLYQEYKEIELGTPQKDPVPARVTLSSGSSVKNFFSSYFSSSSARTFQPSTSTPIYALVALTVIAFAAPTATMSFVIVIATAAAAVAAALCTTSFAYFNRILLPHNTHAPRKHCWYMPALRLLSQR